MDATVPVRRISENSRQYAFRFLHDNIMGLNFEPGRQLSEAELSDTLQLSRTPIREAILTLQDWRLVDVLPQRSSCVALIYMDYVEEGVFLRQVVEAAVLREAAKRAGKDDLAALRENLSLQDMRLSEQRWTEYVEADNEFHRLLYRAAGKPRTWESVNVVAAQLTRMRQLQNRVDVSTFRVGHEEHIQFYNAIERGEDIGFDRAVHHHLTAGYRKVLPMLKKEYPHYFA